MEPTSFQGYRWKKELLGAIYMRRSPEMEEISNFKKGGNSKKKEENSRKYCWSKIRFSILSNEHRKLHLD